MSLPLRRRLVLAAVLPVGLGIGLLLGAFNLVLATRLTRDADSLLRSRAAAQLATLTTVNGHLAVAETPTDGVLDESAWVFAGKRPVARAPGAPEVQEAVRRLASVDAPTTRDAGSHVRLLAVPAYGPSGHPRAGTVIVGVSRDPYERSERIALIGSLVLGALLLIATTILAQRTVRVALRPVARMTHQAAEWSEHDLDRRFGLGPPHDEFTDLAWTLDGLLDRLAASLRHEQRFSAEIAHELRTPLAGTRASAELALRHDRPPEELREALREVVHGADRIAGVVDTLVQAARAQVDVPLGTSDALVGVRAAVSACESRAAEAGMHLRLETAQGPVTVGVEEALVERIVAPALDNAIRYGHDEVSVRVQRRGTSVFVTIADDGPGIAADEVERVFEPGVRGSASAGTPGAGLGLSLARRLARAAGGDATARDEGVVIRLPTAPGRQPDHESSPERPPSGSRMRRSSGRIGAAATDDELRRGA